MGQWSSRLLFNEIYAWGRYCLWYFVHRCLDQTWERQENRDGFVGSYLAPTWWLDVIYYEQSVQGAGLSWRNSEHNQCYIWAQTWVEERGKSSLKYGSVGIKDHKAEGVFSLQRVSSVKKSTQGQCWLASENQAPISNGLWEM